MLTAIATLTKLLLPAMHGLKVRRRRRLNGVFEEAQAALGEQMYAAGIDDGVHGAKIRALHEQLRQAVAVGGLPHALKATRRQLILQLASNSRSYRLTRACLL